MGSDRTRRQSQFCGNHGRTVSLKPHIVDGDFILQSHSDTPSVMTAKWWGEQSVMNCPPRLDYSSGSATGVPLTFSILIASGSTNLASTLSVVMKAT